MAYFILSFFNSRDRAAKAAGELKGKGYIDDISIIMKEGKGDVETHAVKQTTPKAFVQGAEAGGILGVALGIIANIVSFAVPGAGTYSIFGPLALVWGVTGAALGALSGGFIGAFVDIGLPEATAAEYEDRLKKGQTLIAITGEQHKENEVKRILEKNGAGEISVTD